VAFLDCCSECACLLASDNAVVFSLVYLNKKGVLEVPLLPQGSFVVASRLVLLLCVVFVKVSSCTQLLAS